MRTLLVLCCLAVGLFCVVGVAGAVPVSYQDWVLDPTYLSAGDEVGWTHNINDDGFSPETDLLTSASITLWLDDDYDRLDWDCSRRTYELEYGMVTTGGQFYDLGEIDFGFYSVRLQALFELQDSGLLDVKITGTGGDFWFVSSLLCTQGERTAPVPEPGTMLLLGCGLVCLAGAGRKRFHKKGGRG